MKLNSSKRLEEFQDQNNQFWQRNGQKTVLLLFDYLTVKMLF